MKTKQAIAWVTKKVKTILTGQTDVIEIDVMQQIKNQMAARHQKLLASTVHLNTRITARPAQKVDADLDAEIAKAKIDQALDKRIQQLKS